MNYLSHKFLNLAVMLPAFALGGSVCASEGRIPLLYDSIGNVSLSVSCAFLTGDAVDGSDDPRLLLPQLDAAVRAKDLTAIKALYLPSDAEEVTATYSDLDTLATARASGQRQIRGNYDFGGIGMIFFDVLDSNHTKTGSWFESFLRSGPAYKLKINASFSSDLMNISSCIGDSQMTMANAGIVPRFGSTYGNATLHLDESGMVATTGAYAVGFSATYAQFPGSPISIASYSGSDPAIAFLRNFIQIYKSMNGKVQGPYGVDTTVYDPLFGWDRLADIKAISMANVMQYSRVVVISINANWYLVPLHGASAGSFDSISVNLIPTSKTWGQYLFANKSMNSFIATIR